mgnify:CR=1 FL=1
MLTRKTKTMWVISLLACKEYSNIVTNSQKLQIASTHAATLTLVISHIDGLSRSSSSIIVDNWKPLTVHNFLGMFDT